MTERGGSIYGSAGWTLLGFSIVEQRTNSQKLRNKSKIKQLTLKKLEKCGMCTRKAGWKL